MGIHPVEDPEKDLWTTRKPGKVPREWARGMMPDTGARIPAAPGAGVETMCYPGARRPLSQAGGRNAGGGLKGDSGKEVAEVAESLSR